MAEWLVTVPVAGKVTVVMEAATEKEAIDAALEADWLEDIQPAAGFEIEELDLHRCLVEGNVLRVWTNRASAEKLEE